MKLISSADREILEELNREMVAKEEEAAGGNDETVRRIHQFFEVYLSEKLIFRRANGAIANKREFIEGLQPELNETVKQA